MLRGTLRTAGRRAVVAGALALAGGCSIVNGPSDAGVVDAAAPLDLALTQAPLDVTGRYASEITLQLAMGAGVPSTLTVLAKWIALEQSGPLPAEVDTTWELCAARLPGIGDLPYQELAGGRVDSYDATIDGRSDGATFKQPAFAVVLGAQLADPLKDALPTDARKICAAPTDVGCVVPDSTSQRPGAWVQVNGLSPDADVVYVDARITLAVAGQARSSGALDGTVTAASVESHVLACHLRAGGECSAADVAKLEAAHPPLTVTGGTLRSFAQGPYFTCPLFLADPQSAVSGMENAVDGGTPASGGGALVPGPLTFSGAIQRDLDARGCATGGCHELTTGAGAKMHLVYAPSTVEEERANWQAVLPWTAPPPDGGRFVTQTPLPAAVKQRWLAWIAAGAPF